MSTTVHHDVNDGNVLVHLRRQSTFALVGCACHLACGVVDKEM